MSTKKESVCCQENDFVQTKFSLDESCITQTPGFRDVCCNRYVLETALVVFLQHHGPMNDEPLNEEDYFVLHVSVHEHSLHIIFCCILSFTAPIGSWLTDNGQGGFMEGLFAGQYHPALSR